jgi:hypothetical protein
LIGLFGFGLFGFGVRSSVFMLTPRGRHGVAGDSIGLENWPAPFGARRCEPIFALGLQIAIEAAIGGAGGDALKAPSPS